LREELSKYNVKIYDVLENPPAEWAGGVGYATEEMLRANLPAPGSDTMILHCGPPPMNRFVRTTMLAIGHSENLVFKF
jgi:cytochrome-b5 reductase